VLRPPRQVGDAGNQEAEVNRELDEAFGELLERQLG
jgi:hypothetical protein